MSLRLPAPVRIALGCAIAATAVWSTTGFERPRARVVTLLDFFESGRDAVDAFVSDLGPAGDRLETVIDRARAACVRVEVRTHAGADRYQSLAASGVLIEDGRRVLTAGHAIRLGPTSEVLVTLLDGTIRSARVTDQTYEIYGGADRDWAVLEIVGPAVTRFPSAPIASPGTDDLALIVGYPDQIGVDAAGRLAFDPAEGGTYLAPLVTVAQVQTARPLKLLPRAGAIPTSGMSGAPVFDERGRLVGIFVSVGKRLQGRSTEFEYNAAVVASVRPQ